MILLNVPLKGFSDHFFAPLPERLGIVRIEGVSANAFAAGRYGHVVRYHAADVAILAITAADLLSRSNYTGPNRSCRALRDGLPLEGSLAVCRQLLIHLIDQRLYLAGVDMTGQLSVYDSRMHGRGAHPALPMPPVETNREQDIRCL